ncbi:MAG TPA: CoA transferase, partial [Acidimicrobiia bacterium]
MRGSRSVRPSGRSAPVAPRPSRIYRGERLADILGGLRIVDCSEGQAGPLAVRLLAEAGADVVKVEPPAGDRSRRTNPAG